MKTPQPVLPYWASESGNSIKFIEKTDPSVFKNPGSRAEDLFQRMDLNSDGEVTKEEFLKFCRKDEDMAKLFDKKGEGGHALFFGL